jgi:hypothetical protein
MMTAHAHSEDVANRLLADWVRNPEPWERCMVPDCGNFRHGLVCRNHWEKASPSLKQALRALFSPADDDEIRRLVAVLGKTRARR